MNAPELPTAVLLDLDDTIVDDTTPVDSCWAEACQECEGGKDRAQVLSVINDVRAWYWSDAERHRVGRLDMDTARLLIVKMALQQLGREDDLLARRIADRYTRLRDERLELLPGAIETLRWLRSFGCRTALLTNGAGPAQRLKLTRFELEQWFDAICIEGELGFGKPDERIYAHALALLAVAPSNAWMVGDNLTWDIEPAQRLGLRAVWIDRRGSGLPDSCRCVPNRIVRSLSELQES
jgi:putative hydrolase of the HAD superfamily